MGIIKDYFTKEKENLNPLDKWVYHIEKCPYSCSFCMFGGNKVSYDNLNANKVYEEYANIFKTENDVVRIILSDPITNIPNKKYRKFFFELINLILKDPNFKKEIHYIVFYARINHFDEEYINLIKEISNKMNLVFFIGLESLDDIVLKDMNKKFTYQNVLEKTRIIADLNINLLFFFVVGTPMETTESFNLTLERVNELKNIIDNGSSRSIFSAEKFMLMENSPYYLNKENINFISEEESIRRKIMFNDTHKRDSFEKDPLIILDIDADYFFLPTFDGDLIEPQSKRDEVYYKAPDQIDDVIKKFNLQNANSFFKVFDTHDKVYHELKELNTNNRKLILVHIDAHSDIEITESLRPVDLGNWISHLIMEDMIEPDIYWINQNIHEKQTAQYGVNEKMYRLHISKLKDFNFTKRIYITFWTHSQEFCPTNNLLEEFQSKLPNLSRLN